ncbi:hypothetical protein CB1_000490088 [Camelus ferus]|nr:hypothetical protein CB1_000490088 [Camelus ferus]
MDAPKPACKETCTCSPPALWLLASVAGGNQHPPNAHVAKALATGSEPRFLIRVRGALSSETGAFLRNVYLGYQFVIEHAEFKATL